MPTELAIAPALGHGLLATQGGIGATPGYDAIDLRRMIQGLYGNRQGVLDRAGWKVTERAAGGPGMAVDVAAQTGLARVNGGSVAVQGGYVIAPHATMITLDIPASDATNPRVDSVYLVVRDDAHDGSGFTDARVVLLAGTPTAGATRNNRNGAPAAPTSSVHLADLGVVANASSVSNVSIRSYRPLIVPGREVGDTFFWPVNTSPPGCYAINGSARERLVFWELFALLGTTFGAGDGSTTFNIPNAEGGRSLIGNGDGMAFGASGGAQTHTLTEAQLAAHSHNYDRASTATVQTPDGTFHIVAPSGFDTRVTMPSGNNQAHNNMPPYLALRPVIFAGIA